MSPALAQQQAQADPDDLVLTGKAFQGTLHAAVGADPDKIVVVSKFGDKEV
jgi:hypothetical protein